MERGELGEEEPLRVKLVTGPEKHISDSAHEGQMVYGSLDVGLVRAPLIWKHSSEVTGKFKPLQVRKRF